MRLDKYLKECRVGSRSEVKKLVKAGLITVNGEKVKKSDIHIDETSDEICYKGKKLVYEQFLYVLLNKEAGCVTAVSDPMHPTVMEALPEALRGAVTPVGRLDIDTEGLLLFTNDGALAHHIISPNHHVEKTYEAVLDAPVPPEAEGQFAAGIDIGDDQLTLPAKLEILPADKDAGGNDIWRARLTIREGRYHQVKRMFAAVGCHVTGLKRLSIAGLTLEGVAPGQWRKLTEDEVQMLRQ